LLKIHPESESARQALSELGSQPPHASSTDDANPLPAPEEILAQVNTAPRTQSSNSANNTALPPNTTQKNNREGSFRGRGVRWGVLLISLSCLLALSATAFASVVTLAQEPPVLARVIREASPIPPSFTPSFTPSITPSFTPT
jgi:hypothetical protein